MDADKRFMLMSEGLKARPIQQIRQVLMAFGGTVDETTAPKIPHMRRDLLVEMAAGCGMIDIVKKAVEDQATRIAQQKAARERTRLERERRNDNDHDNEHDDNNEEDDWEDVDEDGDDDNDGGDDDESEYDSESMNDDMDPYDIEQYEYSEEDYSDDSDAHEHQGPHTVNLSACLIAAVMGGDLITIKYLIDQGADLGQYFHGEVFNSVIDPRVLDLLFDNGCLDLLDDVWSGSVWHNITTIPIAKWWIKHGVCTYRAILPVARNNSYDVLEYLVEQEHVPVHRDVLCNLVKTYPDIKVIELLIRHGADVNAHLEHFHTPVISIAPLYARYFVDAGADIHATNALQQNILMLLCDRFDVIERRPSYRSLIESLLSMGIDINAVDRQGRTALHHACLGDRVNALICDIVKLGGDVNAVDLRGNTPLHCLYYNSDIGTDDEVNELRAMLIAAGADASVKNLAGKIPSKMDRGRRY